MADQNSDRPQKIALAREPCFRLGEIEIDPPSREVRRGGESLTVEPRVMQVIVALARARGTTLSRDDLVACCWDGRIVGENAIHQVISRARQIAATIGGGAFRIETIPRVGYRLLVSGAGGAPPARRRWPWFAAVGLAILLAAAAFLLWRGGQGPAPPAIGIVAAPGSGPEGAALARGLGVDLSGLPAARDGVFALVEPVDETAPGADFIVRVSTARDGTRADLSLTERGGDRTLWSAGFERRPGETLDLRLQAGAALGGTLVCLSQAAALSPKALQLYLGACGQPLDDVEEEHLRRLREVTARAPGFARGWAALALAEAQALPDPPAEAAARRAAAAHIARARDLDPTLGESYAAEGLLIPIPGGWAERLDRYERGIAADPGYAPLHDLRAFELSRVGRMQESVASARRAAALDPLSEHARVQLIHALAYSGQPAAAFRELESAERIWPGTQSMRAMRYRLELRFSDPRRALRFHDQPDLFDMQNPPTDQSWAAFLHARIDPSPANVQRAIDAFMARYPAGVMGLVQTLGTFGRVDQAYAMFEQPRLLAPLSGGTEVLFRPGMRPLRDDPRFMALAARTGLLRYWRESGIWPDFCLEPRRPYDCRAEAARLSGLPPH